MPNLALLINNWQKQHTTHEPLCDSVTKPQPVPQTQPDTPATYSEFDYFSENFFKLALRALYFTFT